MKHEHINHNHKYINLPIIELKINQVPSHEFEINICKKLDHHTSPK